MTTSCTRQPDGSLRLRMPPALEARLGTWVTVPPVRFRYGEDAVQAALAASPFLRRERRRRGVWSVHATVDSPPAERQTNEQLGAVGVDLHPAHVAVAEVDRCGNVLHAQGIPVATAGRRWDQVRAALGEAAAEVVVQAKAAGKPLAVEQLDFAAKKARRREMSDRRARLRSSSVYAAWQQAWRSRAARAGVEVLPVPAAFTSVLGFAKLGLDYGLSPHAAAGVAIARRGLRFGERLRSRSAFPLPVRHRGPHVWSDWRRVAQRLRAERGARSVSLRGRPRQGETPLLGGSCGAARPAVRWSGCGPGARVPGANRWQRCSASVVGG